ncbi:MAG TPA: SitI3 family protein [Candidatus Limnocylindrales bacterium]|nr:SitI3 family protein [Candidatus Limnocylindrales bacterium]
MALEIRFESAQELAEQDLFAFFAGQCDAELVDLDPRDPFLRTQVMDIMPYLVTPVDEEQEEMEERHAGKIGFRRKISVTFRFSGTAEYGERLAGWEVMLNAVIVFVRKYPAEAVLLFNGEEILMRCHNGEIVFDTSEYFDEEPSLMAIVSRHRQEALEQPLMG